MDDATVEVGVTVESLFIFKVRLLSVRDAAKVERLQIGCLLGLPDRACLTRVLACDLRKVPQLQAYLLEEGASFLGRWRNQLPNQVEILHRSSLSLLLIRRGHQAERLLLMLLS